MKLNRWVHAAFAAQLLFSSVATAETLCRHWIRRAFHFDIGASPTDQPWGSAMYVQDSGVPYRARHSSRHDAHSQLSTERVWRLPRDPRVIRDRLSRLVDYLVRDGGAFSLEAAKSQPKAEALMYFYFGMDGKDYSEIDEAFYWSRAFAEVLVEAHPGERVELFKLHEFHGPTPGEAEFNVALEIVDANSVLVRVRASGPEHAVRWKEREAVLSRRVFDCPVMTPPREGTFLADVTFGEHGGHEGIDKLLTILVDLGANGREVNQYLDDLVRHHALLDFLQIKVLRGPSDHSFAKRVAESLKQSRLVPPLRDLPAALRFIDSVPGWTTEKSEFVARVHEAWREEEEKNNWAMLVHAPFFVRLDEREIRIQIEGVLLSGVRFEREGGVGIIRSYVGYQDLVQSVNGRRRFEFRYRVEGLSPRIKAPKVDALVDWVDEVAYQDVTIRRETEAAARH